MAAVEMAEMDRQKLWREVTFDLACLAFMVPGVARLSWFGRDGVDLLWLVLGAALLGWLAKDAIRSLVRAIRAEWRDPT